MPVIQGNGDPTPSAIGRKFLRRKLTITDKNGVEHVIQTQQDLDAVFAQMTPAELEQWKANYRFAPIQNLTGNPDYTGTMLDL